MLHHMHMYTIRHNKVRFYDIHMDCMYSWLCHSLRWPHPDPVVQGVRRGAGAEDRLLRRRRAPPGHPPGPGARLQWQTSGHTAPSRCHPRPYSLTSDVTVSRGGQCGLKIPRNEVRWQSPDGDHCRTHPFLIAAREAGAEFLCVIQGSSLVYWQVAGPPCIIVIPYKFSSDPHW